MVTRANLFVSKKKKQTKNNKDNDCPNIDSIVKVLKIRVINGSREVYMKAGHAVGGPWPTGAGADGITSFW